jgi:hypothetical protein
MKTIYVGSEGMGYEWGFKLTEYILNKLYSELKIIKSNSIKCDFIVRSDYSQKFWNKYKKPHIFWTAECYPIKNMGENYDEFIYLTNDIDDISKNQSYIYYPYCLDYPYLSHLYQNKRFCKSKKEYFIAYCYKHTVDFRENIFDKFVEKCKTNNKTCNALGKCHGKYPETKYKNNIGNGYESSELLKEYSKHKFVLAIENTYTNGYITEKLLNAYYSNSVPIYYGSDKVFELFNKKSFVYINDFDNLEQCIDFVVNMPDKKYNEYMGEKLINENNDIINLYNENYKNNEYKTNILNSYKNMFDKI